MRLDDLEARVEALATAQEGPAARGQLLAIGLEARQIARWVRRRRLLIRHPGTYLVGQAVVTQRGEAIAALLACREGDVLSGRSSAARWGFRKDSFARPDVTGLRGGLRATIDFHRVRSLDARDLRVRDGVPLTSPARTLLDLAELLPAGEVGRALREARVAGLVTPSELRALIARSPGRAGVKVLKRLLDRPGVEVVGRAATVGAAGADRSRARAAQPLRDGKERDLHWPEHRFIVEVDTWETHEDGPTRTSDRERDNSAAIAGWETRRFMTTQIRDEPLRVLTTIAHRLGARQP